MLSDSPSLQEILWNFSRFKDEKKRLTLRDNPHFYAELPTSPEAYGDGVIINPTKNFRHANKFYVLTDKPEPVYVMTNRVLRPSGNFWCPNNVIIIKGFGILFFFPPVVNVLLDPCGRLRAQGGIVAASLTCTYCGSCRRLLVSTVPGSSKNHRGLWRIITEGLI